MILGSVQWNEGPALQGSPIVCGSQGGYRKTRFIHYSCISWLCQIDCVNSRLIFFGIDSNTDSELDVSVQNGPAQFSFEVWRCANAENAQHAIFQVVNCTVYSSDLLPGSAVGASYIHSQSTVSISSDVLKIFSLFQFLVSFCCCLLLKLLFSGFWDW